MDASYYARWKASKLSYSDVFNRDFLISNSLGNRALHKADSSDGKTQNTTSVKSGLTYTIYTANDSYFTGLNSNNIYDMRQGDMGNRLYYLESSVASAISDMKQIAAAYPLGGVYAALETFAKTVDTTNIQTYLKIGGLADDMTTANATYTANYNTLYNLLSSLKGADGTNQQAALNYVTNLGSLPAGTNKYVVLITDGAPNVDGVNATTIAAAAKTLKQNGYTVITVGLSTREVSVASEILWKAASFVDSSVDVDSTDTTKAKYYYYAETGNDLTWILRDIVRSIMQEATVQATITDEIDQLFYPVSKDGTPLSSGEWINPAGEKVNSNASDAAGQVTYNSTTGKWTVTWKNQEASWGGWNGTVFVKAKEDFMGGNNVSTNASASAAPESYTVNKGQTNEKTATYSDADKQAKTITLATPYVNVDELHMTQNNTEWTVYLGAEVDPSEQLQKLWDSIVINTVVTTDGMNNDYTMSGKNEYYPVQESSLDTQAPESGVETIPLSHYIASDVLTAATTGLLAQLKDGNETTSVTSDAISYSPYGQGKAGSFYITLTKTVNDEAKSTAPDSHVTEKTGDAVETYKLTVTYVPDSESTRQTLLITNGKVTSGDDDYQHHGGHSMEKEAAESISENTHIINVFAKKLKLLKVDQSQQTLTDEAEFVLYRKATTAEESDESVVKKTITGLTGNYVSVQTLKTSNGVITTDALPLIKGTENYDEPYYLVETKAPAGYIMMTESLKVTIDMSASTTLDHNMWGRYVEATSYTSGETYYTFNSSTNEYVEASISSQSDLDNSTVTVYHFVTNSNTKPNPYILSDWLQEATIKVTALDGTTSSSAIRVIPDGEHGITYDSENDTTDASVTYRIINNAGYELPSTGGPGTHIFTILGSILICLAGASLLLMRRRRRA